ncbi:MAG TPA: CPBP family intramembrane glutamic endopeptidase [Rhizomicrobium sp.]|nr:CPBP family intramembrane glutamic endopeptidase [Rhizomicrobium sp.]
MRQRAVVLACVALAYGSIWWPEQWVLAHGMAWLGEPVYAGFTGKFLPHLLLYSTLPALVCAALWLSLSQAKLLAPIPLPRGNNLAGYGVSGAVIAIAATIALILATGMGTLRWIGIDPWGIAGNVFSNFYEEFIFRGFVLAGLAVVIGFWPAAIVASGLWAAQHTQFPWELRVLIGAIGIVWCWVRVRARTLWAPYLSHEIMDTVLDAIIG